MARRATKREQALEALYGTYYCPYCEEFHEEPQHSDPAECWSWYDWCNCSCTGQWFIDGEGI
jgi:hypothetical protein